MNLVPTHRRLLGTLAAVTSLAALGAGAAPSALADGHTQALNVGAELVRQPPGKPWIVNLQLGAELGSLDGQTPAPVDHMKFSFTSGAKVHTTAFGTCTESVLQNQGADACPSSSVLGKGTALAEALLVPFHANVTVFNGPGNDNKRQLLIYARVQEIKTLVIILKGTLRKTSGKYGFVLDIPVPPIHTVGPDNDASITQFDVEVGGFGKKKVPFIEAPTNCKAPGWPFLADFHYADGTSGSSAATIECLIKAVRK